jgi:diguanylate cyclase (GGDEF)-like protein
VGDAVIRALVATCMQTLRATDYIGRFGGEEFVCVMPETRAEDAVACAEQMRTAFASLQIGSGAGTTHGTVSIGISVFSGQPDVDTLVREADTALYRAKAGGRNRVMLSRPGGLEQAC